MPVLDTPQVVVQEVQTVEQLMETAAAMLTVTHLETAAQILPVQEVNQLAKYNIMYYYHNFAHFAYH